MRTEAVKSLAEDSEWFMFMRLRDRKNFVAFPFNDNGNENAKH